MAEKNENVMAGENPAGVGGARQQKSPALTPQMKRCAARIAMEVLRRGVVYDRDFKCYEEIEDSGDLNTLDAFNKYLEEKYGVVKISHPYGDVYVPKWLVRDVEKVINCEDVEYTDVLAALKRKIAFWE